MKLCPKFAVAIAALGTVILAGHPAVQASVLPMLSAQALPMSSATELTQTQTQFIEPFSQPLIEPVNFTEDNQFFEGPVLNQELTQPSVIEHDIQPVQQMIAPPFLFESERRKHRLQNPGRFHLHTGYLTLMGK
jgi:hypothetical protein